MAPPVLRPENAIKRADDLVSVGESQAALQSLFDFITARRIRFADPAAIEPIVVKFLELGIELKKGKNRSKNALHQFKKLIQGNNDGLLIIGSISRKFITMIEAKIVTEHEKLASATENVDENVDLDVAVTPENLLNSVYLKDSNTVSGFNDEEIATWLRFTWESYRTVLDLVRNNSQLEITYSGVVNRTMQFCLKYNRKNEFKRLAEMLRQHLDAANYQQNKNGTNIVDLSDNETLQRYLEQRFQQVNVSVKLELWHEAYRSIEDVFHLMKISKQTPKAPTLANYYQNMARVFLMSGVHNLHTVAWGKFYSLYSKNPNATESDFKQYSSIILLSAVSNALDTLPVIGYDPQLRLYRLVGLESKPTRKDIMDIATEEDIFIHADEDVKKLYNILEENFDNETVKKELAELLPKLETKPYFKQYIKPLKNVITRKIIVSVSEREASINIDKLYEEITLPAPLNDDYWGLEKSLLQAAVEDYVCIKIDHKSNTVTFASDPFEIISKSEPVVEEEEAEEEEAEEEVDESEIPEGEEEEMEEAQEAEGAKEAEAEPEPVLTRTHYIRRKLNELSVVLEGLDDFKEASYIQKVKTARENLIAETKNAIENIKKANEERIKRAQEQKQKYLASAAERAEEDAEMRQKRMLEERTALEAKLAEENQRRAIEKKKREFLELQKIQVKHFIDTVNEKGEVELTPEETEGLDIVAIKKLVFKKIAKNKTELEQRIDIALQKLDHTERAYRESELPLLAKESEALKNEDSIKFEEIKSKILEGAKADHAAKMEDYDRLVVVGDDFRALRDRLYASYQAKHGKAQAEKLAKLEAAKKARVDEIRKQRYDELVAKRQAEIDSVKRQEQAAKQDQIASKQRELGEAAEQKSRAAASQAAKSLFGRGANDERQAKLDAIAQRQREIEEAAERKAKGSPAASIPATGPADTEKPLTFKEKMRLKREAAGK
ncbi:hypothetical protein TPHA_0M01300 [Tetrapisispora phaffii CBS 4417]|uniref:PCI domain-containing protein n=1 Tax=Tetrapisispora phaffii (strain ATCC 24235 / CBS 4417 / NBRC 1672 / NRRL Y-8282 / UCD 70-5) TaxID=1071381 RepID=G8C0J0_TETPH|nr:hypothetical protein TPHA_0M01300 [Tetrapisispora phaffii CBS 4417]CCE65705.1 hypothetical protein TPHA_0M01300 [Tetrapisispora phaffii CBS 4417]